MFFKKIIHRARSDRARSNSLAEPDQASLRAGSVGYRAGPALSLVGLQVGLDRAREGGLRRGPYEGHGPLQYQWVGLCRVMHMLGRAGLWSTLTPR